MISIFDGSNKYVFSWRGEPDPEPDPPGQGEPRSFVMKFATPSQARFLLQQFQNSAQFRRLAANDPAADPLRWYADQILDHLAQQLTTGRLRLERRWRHTPSVNATKQDKVVVPRKTTSPAAPIVEPVTFSPQHDPGSQAGTLAEAAEAGAPFCEECERARQEMGAAGPAQPQQESTPLGLIAKPPGEKASFPANNDAAAQASTLTEAAEEGVPFCEECERAYQQQAA